MNGQSVSIGSVITLNSGATVKLVEISNESNHGIDGKYALKYDPASSASLNYLNSGDEETDVFTCTVSDPENNTDQGSVEVTVEGITNFFAD